MCAQLNVIHSFVSNPLRVLSHYLSPLLDFPVRCDTVTLLLLAYSPVCRDIQGQGSTVTTIPLFKNDFGTGTSA